jgi:putative transposase
MPFRGLSFRKLEAFSSSLLKSSPTDRCIGPSLLSHTIKVQCHRHNPHSLRVYLAVVLDWFTRRVLSWRLSIVMDASFCVETLEDALARHGKPEIFNTDQGSQFTGAAFTGALAEKGITISMDGKGAWRDNVFVERLWRSVKYEEVYLRAYESISDARQSIGRYLEFYNARRPHQSLDGATPNQAYFTKLPPREAA